MLQVDTSQEQRYGKMIEPSYYGTHIDCKAIDYEKWFGVHERTTALAGNEARDIENSIKISGKLQFQHPKYES
jgi:hypothetical protein